MAGGIGRKLEKSNIDWHGHETLVLLARFVALEHLHFFSVWRDANDAALHLIVEDYLLLLEDFAFESLYAFGSNVQTSRRKLRENVLLEAERVKIG